MEGGPQIVHFIYIANDQELLYNLKKKKLDNPPQTSVDATCPE